MFELHHIKYKNILNIKRLTIPKYMVTCIVGESGSGKTTLLRLLNNMISCSQGEILYNNTPINSLNSIELRRNVVMLPQVPAVFVGTIRDNLLLGLKFSEKPLSNDDELNKVLKMIHLLKSLNDNADKLSGGEKQRLALGRVILMKPEVFLLDEPSSSLDEDTEKTIIEQLVNNVKQNNKTLVMVTHSKKIAQNYADIIIELKDGVLMDRKGD